MSNSDRTRIGLSHIKRYALLLVVAWSVIVFALLLWNAIQAREETRKYAHIYTNSAFEKDILYRRWATMHEGVYVPVTNKTPPNPYLSDMPERDITTPSGRRLTLMNPAYMTRQVYELEREVSGARSHLTSSKPIKPENAPDEWEKKALVAFERGVTEISSIENIEGREYFRLMRPFITEEGCLKCHAKQGYKVNDIRGGISVSLPMDSIRELAGTSQSRNILIYLLLWLVGTGGIAFGYYRVNKSESIRNQAENELEAAYLDLEKKVHDRTADLNKVNEMLQESEERLRLSTALANVAVWEYSFMTNSMSRSSNHDQLYGLEWQTKWDISTFLKATHPDDREYSNGIIQKSVAAGGPDQYTFDFRVVYPDQSIHWLMATGQVIERNSEGQGIVVRGCLIDITVRKQAEDKLHQSEELFSKALLASPSGMTITRIADGEFINANESFLSMFEFSHEETIGHTSTELKMWSPEEREKLIAQQLASGGLRNFELLARSKSGRFINLLFSSKKVELDGEACHITTFVDITERKRAEAALLQANERLALAQRSAGAGMWDWDMPTGMLNWSPELFRLFGLDPEKTSATFDVWRSVMYPEDRQTAGERINEAIRDHKALFNEYRIILPSGQVRWINALGNAQYAGNGEPLRMLGICLDITERKQAEEELRKYRDHLEKIVMERTKELNEAQEALVNIVEDLNEKGVQLAQAMEQAQSADRLKSAFLATMSHELRTPLNSIIGFTGIVLQGMSGSLNEEQAKQLTMVKSSANHLLDLINDVLDISKIEAGQVQLTRKSFDMRSVIEAALRAVMPLAAKKGLSLDSVIASDVGVMIGDRRRVEQILINLVGNAVKFTEQGTVRIAARLVRSEEPSSVIPAEAGIQSSLYGSPFSQGQRLDSPVKPGNDRGDFVEISVTDTGIGIKAEDVGKLFIPFSQIDTGLARNHEGTGLGLSICGKLLEMLGGTIRVESEWGKGSTFTFTLPLS